MCLEITWDFELELLYYLYTFSREEHHFFIANGFELGENIHIAIAN